MDAVLPERKKRKICHTGLTAEIDFLSLAEVKPEKVRASTPRELCAKLDTETNGENCPCSNFEAKDEVFSLQPGNHQFNQNDTISPIEKVGGSVTEVELYKEECLESHRRPLESLPCQRTSSENGDIQYPFDRFAEEPTSNQLRKGHSNTNNCNYKNEKENICSPQITALDTSLNFRSPKCTAKLRVCQNTSGYATGSDIFEGSVVEKEIAEPENDSFINSVKVLDNCEMSFNSSLGDSFEELDGEKCSAFLANSQRSRCDTISQFFDRENSSPTTPIRSVPSRLDTHSFHMETPISGSMKVGALTKNIKFEDQVQEFEPNVTYVSKDKGSHPSRSRDSRPGCFETPVRVSKLSGFNNKSPPGAVKVIQAQVMF